MESNPTNSSSSYKITIDPDTKYIYLDPVAENQPHQYTMIFLHGLGDSAEGFLTSFSEEEWLPNNCRIILPTAPEKPVSCNGG